MEMYRCYCWRVNTQEFEEESELLPEPYDLGGVVSNWKRCLMTVQISSDYQHHPSFCWRNGAVDVGGLRQLAMEFHVK